MLYSTTSLDAKLHLVGIKGATSMSKNIMTSAQFVAPTFNSNYPTTTWAAKRAFAHFGNEAYGVNG